MPYVNDGAARLLFEGVGAVDYCSLHTGAVPSAADELEASAAPGYARKEVGVWAESTAPAGAANSTVLRFRASGGGWPTFRSVALRDGSAGAAPVVAYASLAAAREPAGKAAWLQ